MSNTSLTRTPRRLQALGPGALGQPMLACVMAELRDAGQGGLSPPTLTAAADSPLDLAELLAAIQAAIKAVSATLRSSGLVKWRNAREVAAEIFTNYIASSRAVALLVCDEKAIPVENGGDRQGKYVVCVSPLDTKHDGADPAGLTTMVAGSVFSVHRYLEPPQPRSAPTSATSRPGQAGRTSATSRPSLRSALQPGRNLVAAGYALYASSTVLVLSTGQSPGVHLFALDPVLGEFILTAPNLTIPGRGRTYSVDEGLTYEWGDPVVGYVESKKDPKLGTPYGSHHIGCTVADVHNVLRHGGIYLSPQTRTNPSGKLRLVLEAAPLAHLVCRAGGLATDGHASLSDCQPEGLAHRTAAFLGSREDVRDLLALFRRGVGSASATSPYSARPSSLRAGSGQSAPTPSTSATTTSTGQQVGLIARLSPVTAPHCLQTSKEQRPAKERIERGVEGGRAALAEAELAASMATLTATLEALRPSAPTTEVSYRPTSAVYPSSTGSMLGLVPSVQRPVSAASAASATSGPLEPLLTSLPYSLPHSMTGATNKRVP